MTPTGTTVMPANLVKGKDLDDVAAFVAMCAGNPEVAACSGGGKVTSTDGKTIFQTAGCSTATRWRTPARHGNVGPNLDQAKPPKSLVVDRVTNGKGVMPSFKAKLTPEQIQAVAKYVSSVAGKYGPTSQVARGPRPTRPPARSASRSTTTCVIGTVKRCFAPGRRPSPASSSGPRGASR